MSSVGDAPDEGAAGEIALTIEHVPEAAAPLLLFSCRSSMD